MGTTLGDAATVEGWAFVAEWAFVACWTGAEALGGRPGLPERRLSGEKPFFSLEEGSSRIFSSDALGDGSGELEGSTLGDAATTQGWCRSRVELEGRATRSRRWCHERSIVGDGDVVSAGPRAWCRQR